MLFSSLRPNSPLRPSFPTRIAKAPSSVLELHKEQLQVEQSVSRASLASYQSPGKLLGRPCSHRPLAVHHSTSLLHRALQISAASGPSCALRSFQVLNLTIPYRPPQYGPRLRPPYLLPLY